MTSPGQPLLASLLPTIPLQPLAAGLAPPLAVTLASGCACVRVRCFVHFCPALLMSSCTVLYCPGVLCTTVQLYCALLSSCTVHYCIHLWEFYHLCTPQSINLRIRQVHRHYIGLAYHLPGLQACMMYKFAYRPPGLQACMMH